MTAEPAQPDPTPMVRMAATVVRRGKSTSKLLDQQLDIEGTPQFGDLVVCHVQIVDSNEPEIPAGRRNTEKLSAMRTS